MLVLKNNENLNTNNLPLPTKCETVTGDAIYPKLKFQKILILKGITVQSLTIISKTRDVGIQTLLDNFLRAYVKMHIYDKIYNHLLRSKLKLSMHLIRQNHNYATIPLNILIARGGHLSRFINYLKIRGTENTLQIIVNSILL